MSRFAAAVIVVLTLLAVRGTAAAQGGRDPAAAQALFDKGLELLKKEDWAAACPQFEASMKLEPSVGAQVNIARCAEHVGLVARAWAEFKRAKSMNQETAGAQRKKEVDAYVDGEIAKLEPRLPWVTIRLSPRPADVDLKRDGVSIPIEGVDQKVPIDPGKHTFSATAPGYVESKKTVDIGEGATVEVVLELVKGVGPTQEPPPTRVGEEPSAGPDPLLIAGGVTSGVGALTLAVAAITGGLAYSDHGTLDDLVDRGDCVESGEVITCDSADARATSQDAIDRGESLALGSTITLFAGAAIAATGITLIVVGATRGPAKPSDAVIIPLLSPGFAGLAVGGRF